MARYTFFETATQNGYVVALMQGKMEKSRDSARIVLNSAGGRVFQMMKQSDPDRVVFAFIIPERGPLESQELWRQKCKVMLEGEWKKYKKDREALRNGSGGGIQDKSESQPSRSPSSSTDITQNPGSLTSKLSEGEPDLTASVQEPLTQESSEITPLSSPTFVAQ